MRRVSRRTLLSTAATAAAIAATRCGEPRQAEVLRVPVSKTQGLAVPMPPVVLVHGAWAGGWAWKRVASILRARGHEVFTPTLTGLGERRHLATPQVDLDTHINDIVNLLAYEDLERVVLVGWSYGGMVISGVLDRIPQRLTHVVYLDAEVPRDGESDFDLCGPKCRAETEEGARTSGDGWRVSLSSADEALLRGWIPDDATRQWFISKLVSSPQPIKTFSQPLRLLNAAADSVPRTFIRCPVDGAIWAHIYDPIADRLRADKRWQVREVAANHLAPIVAPDLVVEELLGVVRTLSAASPETVRPNRALHPTAVELTVNGRG